MRGLCGPSHGPRNAGFCYTCRSALKGAKSARPRPDFALHQPMFGEWLSLVEHLVRDQGVGGSNPLSPTIIINNLQMFYRNSEIQCRRFCSGQSLQVPRSRIPEGTSMKILGAVASIQTDVCSAFFLRFAALAPLMTRVGSNPSGVLRC